jgi:hypothetical protein
MNAEQFNFISQQLEIILGNDNDARKQAEQSINEAKAAGVDSYALCMVNILNPESGCSDQAKSLSAVILRRNISVGVADFQDFKNKAANLWEAITEATRNEVRAVMIKALSNHGSTAKPIIHKIANLAVEIQGAMQTHENDAIWQDLLNLIF